MAVRVTDDGMGHIWVTSTLDDRGPAVRFTMEEWKQFINQVRADLPNAAIIGAMTITGHWSVVPEQKDDP